MNESLNIRGALEETTVPDLFRSLIRSHETAILTLEAESRHDMVFFEEGEIVAAGSSDPDLSVAAVLFQSGDLDLRQFNEANERISTDKSMSDILCDLGFLTPDELTYSEEKQVANIVEHAVRFRSGRYSIDFIPEIPSHLTRQRVDTERMILDAVRNVESWSLISRGLARFDRVALRQAEGADARIFSLEVTEEEMHLYSSLTEPQTLEGLCERSYLSNFETCRTIWALWGINLIEAAEKGELIQQRAETEEELELEAIVERYNAVFMSLFATVHEEIGDHVWDFIDRVVRHMSPDRLPYLSGISFTNEARVDFDQLLNNLIASGLDDRMSVANDVLNQLLYGWIVETRQEFGARLQTRVDEIVAPLLEDRR
ncbi:MAG: DUF4388 domain-containing protein [Thermoanaerobaculia bacterium]|nr:DUF4388 domain-containing protein [Thermoanaerobaculia bacterium]